MRAVFQWNLGTRTLELGKRTLIMGIVNVTPDSFSDGGLYLDANKAVDHALQLLDEGADIIDIGGESTRPGAHVADRPSNEDAGVAEENAASAGDQFAHPVAENRDPSASSGQASLGQLVTERANDSSQKKLPVNAEEEVRRVLPVIEALKQQKPDAVISIDTYKAEVARAAVAAGAEIVNDVSGFRWDPQMVKTISDLKCAAILMHMRGHPDEWRTLPPPADVVLLVKRELREWAEAAVLAGVRRERIVLDPGFGFGKNFGQNYPLVGRFQELQSLGFPLLAGTSRKSFVGRALAKDGKDAAVADRLYGNLAMQTILIMKGVHVLRTHDVKAAADAAKVTDNILNAH
jgi:dihydropteroate synthase